MNQKFKWAIVPLIFFGCQEFETPTPATDDNTAQKIASNFTTNETINVASVTRKVYYLAGYPGDIFRINADGTGDTKLTTDGKNGNLDVSADGSKIVFANSAKNNWNIYIADLTTNGIANKRTLYAGRYRDEDCKFSRDGRKVAFKTNEFAIAQYGNSRAYDLCLIDVASGVVTKLTNNSNAEAWAPCFSPDGTKVAFVLRANSQGQEGDEIYLINTDGSNLKRITNNSYADWYPTFSANGNLIYASQKVASCDDDLYQISASALSTSNPGSQATVIPVSACSLVSDADPYSSKAIEDDLVFVSTRSGAYAIYLGNKSTGVVSTIISKSGIDLLGPTLID
jgi:dipeptidyl aminopeptidase/acylaminoacyl peptidase